MIVQRAVCVVLLVIARVASTGVAPGAAATGDQGGHVDWPLEQLARAQPASTVRVIVH